MKPKPLFSITMSLAIVSLLGTLAGCSQQLRRAAQFPSNCIDLDAKLRDAWAVLEEGKSDPRKCQAGTLTDLCENSRREIERIALQCPGSATAQLASAILSYERREMPKSQQILDSLLSKGDVNPDAAALRARLALEEGNVPYAIRFLTDQIRLAPADYRLRETLASAFYLARRWSDAANELQSAERLGAPAWRIAYHNGLVLEAEGRTNLAVGEYQKVLVERPSYTPAADRIKALKIVVP